MCVNYKTAIHTSFQLILKQNPRNSSRNASSLTVIDICFSVQYLCISWHNSITVNECVYILTRFAMLFVTSNYMYCQVHEGLLKTRFAFVNVYLQMIYQYFTFIIKCIFFFFFFFFLSFSSSFSSSYFVLFLLSLLS